MQMSNEIAASVAQPMRSQPSAASRYDASKLDAWSALIAACASPHDWVVIERDGELFVEPAPTAQ